MNEQIKQIPQLLQEHIADHEAKELLIIELQMNVAGRDETIETQRAAIIEHVSTVNAHIATIDRLNAELATAKQQHADEITKLMHAHQGLVNAAKSESARLQAHIDKIDPDRNKAKRADLEERMKRLMDAYRQMYAELAALASPAPDDVQINKL